MLTTAQRPVGTEFASQCTRSSVSGSVEHLVAYFGTGIALWLIRKPWTQMQADLLRTPQLIELDLHKRLQTLIGHDLLGLGMARLFMGKQVSNHGFVRRIAPRCVPG